MALPPLEPDHPVVAHRLETFEDLGNSQVDKGFFYVRCDGCGFDEWDRTFTAWPGRAHASPSELVAFVEGQARAERVRKCPECHEEAQLVGLRVFVMSTSLDRDLVAEHDLGQKRTAFALMDRAGQIEDTRPDGEAMRSACFDSCLRAGSFIAEVTPDRRSEAEDLFKAVAEARPDRPLAHLALARLAYDSGDEVGALDHAARAAECAMDEADACSGLGSLLGEIALAKSDGRRLEESVRWYTRALELSPNDQRLNLALARLLIQSGNFKEAAPHLDRAERDQATTLEARYLQGVMALHQGRAQAAAQLLSELAEDAPGDASVLHMLAWSLAQSGQRSAAEEALEMARRLSGSEEEHAYFAELVADALQQTSEEPS